MFKDGQPAQIRTVMPLAVKIRESDVPYAWEQLLGGGIFGGLRGVL